MLRQKTKSNKCVCVSVYRYMYNTHVCTQIGERELEFLQHLAADHHFQILLAVDICDHQNPGIQPLLEH